MLPGGDASTAFASRLSSTCSIRPAPPARAPVCRPSRSRGRVRPERVPRLARAAATSGDVDRVGGLDLILCAREREQLRDEPSRAGLSRRSQRRATRARSVRRPARGSRAASAARSAASVAGATRRRRSPAASARASRASPPSRSACGRAGEHRPARRSRARAHRVRRRRSAGPRARPGAKVGRRERESSRPSTAAAPSTTAAAIASPNQSRTIRRSVEEVGYVIATVPKTRPFAVTGIVTRRPRTGSASSSPRRPNRRRLDPTRRARRHAPSVSSA